MNFGFNFGFNKGMSLEELNAWLLEHFNVITFGGIPVTRNGIYLTYGAL